MKIDEKPAIGTKLYRYEDGIINGSGIELYAFVVKKHTPYGLWIEDEPYMFRNWRFMYCNTRRPYAHKAKSEALRAYMKRKEYQVKILEKQLATARHNLVQAKKRKNNNEHYKNARPTRSPGLRGLCRHQYLTLQENSL